MKETLLDRLTNTSTNVTERPLILRTFVIAIAFKMDEYELNDV